MIYRRFFQLILLAIIMLSASTSWAQEPVRLRVMSYNIHHGRGMDGQVDLPRIAAVINAARPDLVALQEVDNNTQRSGGVDEVAELARLTGMHGIFGEARPYDGGLYGQGILSKFPIESFEVHQLPGPSDQEQRIAVAARIHGEGRVPDLTFIGTHLHHADDAIRLDQARALIEILSKRELPIALLAGDFNAVPESEAMNVVLKEWSDTTGDSALTFPVLVPVKKIDWILQPKPQGWRVVSSEVIEETAASDHRPVIVEFEVPSARSATRAEILIPPVLVQKEANRWPEAPAGKVVQLDSATSTSFTLFIPENVEFNAKGETTLTIHFHGASWFMQQEHARRGAAHPLLVGNAAEGDAVYEIDIMKPGVMASLLDQTSRELNSAASRMNAKVGLLELSGFSAGYAGVRGILRQPEYEPMVARVMLNDSVYVGDGPDSNPPDHRKPRRGADGMDPFIDFARKAAAGERTLLMAFSSTPSFKSVGPMECARDVIEELKIPIVEVPLNSIPAARETADYQLMWRADSGHAHFWCYRAEERPIHLAHVRNQATMWRALEGQTSLEAVPPVMTPRPIKPTDPPFQTIPIDIGTTGTVSLYLPMNYAAPKDGAVELTVHFHGATWFVIQEHLSRGNGDPLVVLELGQGSTVYRVPFEDEARFAWLLTAVTEELQRRGAPEDTRIASVNITSFSAGYGAVREIVKSHEYVTLIKRIILGDSLYGSLDEEELKKGLRAVAPEHVEPWLNYARHALAGEKTLLLTTSDITPESYAGTHEVARAVAKALKVEIQQVPPDSDAASSADLNYPLHTRADAGSFHWWAYGGEDAVVHMTLARHIADAWEALDQCGDR